MGERSASRRYGRLDDVRLAALVRKGDTGAFEALYDRHHAPLLAFCRHMLGSLQEAEDALQQTFMRAHRALCDRPPPDAVRPWLFTIARNRCHTLLAARRESVVALEDFEPGFDGLAEDVGRRADLRELVHDLARLPDDQREALVLFELGGSSHAQIAQVLACPPAKVKALVFQARSTLIAERDARSIPCEAIREQLAVARGGLLRRGPLRRHLRQCAPCDAYRLAVVAQRDGLASLLPVVPSAGLKAAVLAGAGLSGGGGTAAAATSLGGLAAAGGATSAGGLAVTALVAKVAVTLAVAGAGVSGAIAAVGSDGGGAGPEIRTAVPTPGPAAQPPRPAPAATDRSASAESRTVGAPAELDRSHAISRRRATRRHRARRAAHQRRSRRRAALRRRIAADAPRREARRETRRAAKRHRRREAGKDARQKASQDVRRGVRREARRDAKRPDRAPRGGSHGDPPDHPRRERSAPAPAPTPVPTPEATATPVASATPAVPIP